VLFARPRSPEDRFKSKPCGGVVEAEIAVANDQETHGSAPEIGDGLRRIFETEEGIAPRDARLAQTAMAKHCLQKMTS
jgi:hypothetical protein